MFLRTFGSSLTVTILGLLAAGLLWGPGGLGAVLILAVLEISLSFDNAVVNAGVLRRMNPFWQRVFLTVGVLIAVFGMRLLFPLLVVGLTAHLAPGTVIELALDPARSHHGHTYAEYLRMADPAIAAFGGTFLLMIFLDFVFTEKEFNWLIRLERRLERIGRLETASSVVALLVLAYVADLGPDDRAETVLLAGVLGLACYLAVKGVSSLFESNLQEREETEQGAVSAVLLTGKAAFFLFLYLEMLDAAFSFDGVVGAFAVSQNIFMIALGLGIGAMYIRSLTVYLVRRGTLDEYVYLEHGAHYAIGALAAVLLVSVRYRVPELVTGLIGVVFIGSALVSSVRHRRGLATAY